MKNIHFLGFIFLFKKDTKAKVSTKNFHSAQSPVVITTVPFVNPSAYIGRARLAGPKEFFKLCIF